ncbi:MAG: hypothetical protein SNI70_08980 [Rikenellaceae bacterium]
MKQQEKSSYEMMYEEMKASNKDLKERLEGLNNRVMDGDKLKANLKHTILIADRAYTMKYVPFAKSVYVALQQMNSHLKAIIVSIDRLEKGSEQFKKGEAEKNRHTFTISFKLTRDLCIVLFVLLVQLVAAITVLIVEF